MNMVKNDLSEFVCTIQHDTSAVVADTATAVKESLKVPWSFILQSSDLCYQRTV